MDGTARPEDEPLLEKARTATRSLIPQHLSDTDVANIWFCVSQYIAHVLGKGRGVTVPGLGSFIMHEDTPHFALSESFLQANDLRSQKPPQPMNLATVSLNYTQISIMCEFDRYTVESCVKEVLQALARQIRESRGLRGVSLMFFGIGKLSIKSGKVRFHFFNEFLEEPAPLGSRSHKSYTLASRPTTVGLYGSTPQTGSRPTSTRSGLATPRLLATPSISTLGTDLGRMSVSSLRPWEEECAEYPPPGQLKKKAPIKWQSSLTSGGMQLPIVDSVETEDRDEVLIDESSDPVLNRTRAARPRPRPQTADFSLLKAEEVETLAKLARRNMHASVKLPPAVGESRTEADPILKSTDWSYGGNPRIPVATYAPEVHKRNLSAPESEKPMDYDSWLKAQQEGTLKQGRRRARIRDQGDHNSAIPRQRRAAEEEEDRRLEELRRTADARSEALESILTQARAEARKRAATFNTALATSQRLTAKDEAAVGTDVPGVGADVMVYRPATSHSAIRRDRHQHSEKLRTQAEQRRLEEIRCLQEEKEEDRIQRLKHEEQLRKAETEALERQRKLLRDYKAELDQQCEYRQKRLETYKGIHPRQAVPFDVKHLPSNSRNYRPTNSAVGRPAAALGPEMYREHDQREERSKVINRRAYEAQVEFHARRNRTTLEEKVQESVQDRTIAVRNDEVYADELREIAKIRKKEREELEQRWEREREEKRRRDDEELKHRKLPADVPIRDQLDYSAYVNGFI